MFKKVIGALVLFSAALSATADAVKFQYDWQFQGPAAFFLVPQTNGYFKNAGLDVTVDSGNGSSGTIVRVASGAYDMGFADMATLMEFYANNPDAVNKPIAVMMMFNTNPAAVVALKKSGIRTPADLNGKRLGSPIFEGSRKSFPIFARANNVTNVTWTTMEPSLRETMLLRGDIDAITGFASTIMLNLEPRGVKPSDVTIMPYSEYGVNFYGNAVIVSPKFLKEHPDAVRAFLTALAKGAKDVMADPAKAVASVKERNGLIDSELETRRLQMAIKLNVNTAGAHTDGFGQVSKPRLALMSSQVADAFNTRGRINPDVIWTDAYLPNSKDLDVLPKLDKTKVAR